MNEQDKKDLVAAAAERFEERLHYYESLPRHRALLEAFMDGMQWTAVRAIIERIEGEHGNQA